MCEELTLARNAKATLGLCALAMGALVFSPTPTLAQTGHEIDPHHAHVDRTKVLVMRPTGRHFSLGDRKTFGGLIASAISRRPHFAVITEDEQEKALKLDAERQILGCHQDQCLGDLASMLSARLVVLSEASKLGSLIVLNLTLFDSIAGKSVSRASAQAPRLSGLPTQIRVAADALVKGVIDEQHQAMQAKDHMTCPSGMVRIPAGQFFQGAEDDDDPQMENARPSHQVTLSSYCIDQTEVTVSAYASCAKAGKCRRAGRKVKWPGLRKAAAKRYSPVCNTGKANRAQHPINCVNWKMAIRYCKAQGKRLPTEAEWEYAARGPDGRHYPWGDDEPTAADLNACGAECSQWGKKNGVKLKQLYAGNDGYPTTAPVGSFPGGASRFGPVDVVGNVWEWVSDYFAPFSEDDVSDPQGPPSGKKRVVRGGAFNGSDKHWLRPAYRFSAPPSQRSHAIGFRCARSLIEE